MRKLISLLVFLPLLSLAQQGVSVRATNGVANNLAFQGNGAYFGTNSTLFNDATLATAASRITIASTNWPPGILGGNSLTIALPAAISGTAGQFTCGASTLEVGAYVVIKGTLGGTALISGYTSGNMYKVSAVTGTSPNVTGFTLTTTTGAAISTTAGTLTGLTFDRIPPGQANELAKATYPNIVIGTNLIPGISGNGHMAVPNGFMIASAPQSGGEQSKIWFVASHSGSSGDDGVLLLAGSRDLDLIAGNNGTVQIGNSGNSKNQYINIQYNQRDMGYSHLFSFRTAYDPGTRSGAASLLGETSPVDGYADLHFFSKAPTWNAYPSAGFSDPGVRVMSLDTDSSSQSGLRLHSRLTQARAQSSASSISVNFGSGYLQDVSASSASIAVTFANQRDGTTNIIKKLLYLRSNGLTVASITWPSGISVISEAGSVTALPTTLAPVKVLRVEFESIGTTASSVIARYWIGDDSSFTYDSDASAFFTAASISVNSQKAAVNQFVLDLKAASLWTKMQALYPFVGGNATAHSKNLKGSSFTIAWTGAGVTHDANGITGNGTTAYGDTGYVPSTHGTLNSQHISVYCRTPSPGYSAAMGGNDGSGNPQLAMMLNNGVSVTININGDAFSPFSIPPIPSGFQNFLAGSRTTSSQTYIQAGTAASGFTKSSLSLGGNSVLILARNYPTPDSPTTANLAFASIGTGLDGTELLALKACVTAYQTALGRL